MIVRIYIAETMMNMILNKLSTTTALLKYTALQTIQSAVFMRKGSNTIRFCGVYRIAIIHLDIQPA